MIPNEEGFFYPNINIELCISCKECQRVCMNEIRKESSFNQSKVYAAYSNQNQVRVPASSGGIVREISEEIMYQAGVVFGAKFKKDFMVEHVVAVRQEELNQLSRSKYVQSEIHKSYQQVKRYLLEGKKVLFVGTGCQVHGLKSYLGKEYRNLLCIDFICHGVPSPYVWNRYLKSFGKEPKDINFRDKEMGWKSFRLKIKFQDNSSYSNSVEKDLYMQSFLKNLILREACYNCKYKGDNAQGDITVGDFWNIDRIDRSINDNKGVSMVIVNTPKGQDILDLIKERISIVEVDKESAINCNPSYVEIPTYNKKRNQLFQDIKADSNIIKVLRKYTREGVLYRIRRRLSN